MSDAILNEKLRQLDKALIQVMFAEISIIFTLNPAEKDNPELQTALKDYLKLQKSLEKRLLSPEQLKEIADEFRKMLATNWLGQFAS